MLCCEIELHTNIHTDVHTFTLFCLLDQYKNIVVIINAQIHYAQIYKQMHKFIIFLM